MRPVPAYSHGLGFYDHQYSKVVDELILKGIMSLPHLAPVISIMLIFPIKCFKKKIW